MCIKRPRWKGRGKFFTEYGLSVTCVKPDMSCTVSLITHSVCLSHVSFQGRDCATFLLFLTICIPNLSFSARVIQISPSHLPKLFD